jgi:putative nucleotidyltransferase with HDIG domain
MYVLVVDDEKSIRVTLKKFLENEGYTADTAENAIQAIDLIEDNTYDVILSDIIMPKMSGVEFLEKVKKMLPDSPVIMMTGEPTVETAVVALQRGAFDYLKKPVQKEELLKSVNQAMQVRLLMIQKKRLESQNQNYISALEVAVRDSTDELDHTMQSTIKVMTSLVNSRDHYTSEHQIHVGNLAASIAQELGMASFRATGIRIAGYLHDIGKLSVPSSILVKPVQLTQYEFDIVKTHSESGYKILNDLRLPWPVAEFVYQHHERLDGSGYPRGLRGTDILFDSRILAVSDVVEAMASHRPYRASLGITAALDEILSGKNTAYDPDVVDACISVMKNNNYKFENSYIEASFVDFDKVKIALADASSGV